MIAAYRQATGEAPLPPKWALGYWQSKERYNSQQEWLDIAADYRSRREPIDNMVQDWCYWNPYPWGSHKFDPKRYPDPAAGIAALHDKYHLHLMISVWGKFEPGSPTNPNANYDAMNAQGISVPAAGRRRSAITTPSTPAPARSTGSSCGTRSSTRAWMPGGWTPRSRRWTCGRSPVRPRPGLGARVLNAWPLMHTTAVSQGQRAAAPKKRVFILTRSAYAGQQRRAPRPGRATSRQHGMCSPIRSRPG